MLSDLWQDVRLAVRGLQRTPGFAVVVIATLAICIGANSAIFSVVNAVLLKPLPFREPGGLVRVYQMFHGERGAFSGPNFIDLTKQSRTLASAAAFDDETFNVVGTGDPVRVNGTLASASFFNVLGVQPIIGRGFNPDENEPGKSKVVVLSHAFWRQRFGSNIAAIGTPLDLDGSRYTIIGVMPPNFDYPRRISVWIPLVYDTSFTAMSRGADYLAAVARVKNGATVQQAATEAVTIGRRLHDAYPDHNAHMGMTALSMRDAMVGNVRKPLIILLGAVVFVLLIACANIANLLLARSSARQTEMAVRSALGAARGRLLRQLLTESILLSLIGGALGLLLATWGVRLLLVLKPTGIPRLDTVTIDGSVMMWTALIAVATGVIFGIAPALQLSRGGDQLAHSLRAGGRGMLSSSGGRQLRSALIVSEIALALVLLTGAGLMMRSFVRLQSVDPGFRSDKRLALEVAIPSAKYDTDAKIAAFYDNLLERIGSLQGAQETGAISMLPLSNNGFGFSFTVDGRAPVNPGDEPHLETRVLSADFDRVLGIPVKRGRGLLATDRTGAPAVAVINEAAARRFFPGEDPIGKHVVLGWRTSDTTHVNGTIVGVVGDVRGFGLDQEPQPEIDFPYAQVPVSDMAIIVRTDASATAVAAGAKRELSALDPTLPMADLRSLESIVADSISQPRFYMVLLGVFALIALLLAAIGVAGMMSFAVAQRTREIGIRVALGANRGGVVRLVLREAMRLAVLGVVIGGLVAIALSRAMASLLFGIGVRDPATFAIAATVLAGVAFAATLLPARRAASVDPATALRAD
ncbi:MAG: ABC transporter permease [Gemmatimonadales bacterium]